MQSHRPPIQIEPRYSETVLLGPFQALGRRDMPFVAWEEGAMWP